MQRIVFEERRKKLVDQIDCNALQFQANVNIALNLTSLKYAHRKKLTRHEG